MGTDEVWKRVGTEEVWERVGTAMSVPWCGTVGVLPVASRVRIASRQHLIAIPEAAQ